MKSVAILIDAGFFVHKYREHNGGSYPRAEDIDKFARSCIKSDEELFRIYYYDCPPHEGKLTRPISDEVIDNAVSKQTAAAKLFQSKLAQKDYVALRKGYLSFDGWALKSDSLTELKKTPRTLTQDDFFPLYRQKQVDIKIGLDVAWLSTKHIVDRILLVAGDFDFAPVLKFARREGVQTVLVTLKHTHVKAALREHCDEFRNVDLISTPRITTKIHPSPPATIPHKVR